MKEKHLLKRLPALIGALVLAAGLFAGCSGRGGGKEVSVDLGQAAGDILKAGGYTEELIELDEGALPASYPKLEMDKVEKYTCRVSGSSWPKRRTMSPPSGRRWTGAWKIRHLILRTTAPRRCPNWKTRSSSSAAAMSSTPPVPIRMMYAR